MDLVPPNRADAPVEGAMNRTMIPGTGLFATSSTCATRTESKTAPTSFVWFDPATLVTPDTEPATFVNVNTAGGSPPTVPQTWNVPAVLFAERSRGVAMPEAFVCA